MTKKEAFKRGWRYFYLGTGILLGFAVPIAVMKYCPVLLIIPTVLFFGWVADALMDDWKRGNLR